jgi:sugar phosphate isomerase/epimerase
MIYTRREFAERTLGFAGIALTQAFVSRTALSQTKSGSAGAGVLVGIIAPYSFRGTAMDIPGVISGMTKMGLRGVELQHTAAEAHMGAPSVGRGATSVQAEALRDWRRATPASTFQTVRRLFNEAGIRIYAYKLAGSQVNLSDDEFRYAFDVARTLGASHVNIELPDSALTKRLGAIASEKKMMIGYHGHQQSSLTAWDEAISQSPFNGINLDIGHYVAATNESPMPLINKHYDRLTSIHVKDRQLGTKGGKNLPWGHGDTPIVEVVQLLKAKKSTVPLTIELEYQADQSDVMTELAKSLAYLKKALE